MAQTSTVNPISGPTQDLPESARRDIWDAVLKAASCGDPSFSPDELTQLLISSWRLLQESSSTCR